MQSRVKALQQYDNKLCIRDVGRILCDIYISRAFRHSKLAKYTAQNNVDDIILERLEVKYRYYNE